ILGFALMKQGSPDVAARHFTRALELDPQHAGAFNNFGLILKESGQMSDDRGQMTEDSS
ncbi:MAG: tetratricopeptide repeat protein, partial [Deltaproteobacteria bacterium]|nr:tetratricopeptide repeat protein [Deltaproteobacteria bacterium]